MNHNLPLSLTGSLISLPPLPSLYPLLLQHSKTPSNLLDQLNLKALLQQMSESERESATSPSENNQHSREHHPPQKKKHIKKDKSTQAYPKLTKEERAKMQKEKNREAAQRSRDQHKEYVCRLEQEVKDLRLQVDANRQYCSRCRQELDCQFFETTLKQEEILEHSIFPEVSPAQMQAEEIEPTPQEEDVADYFLRVKHQEEDEYAYIKMMMFVAMVVIGVMIFPTGPHGRKLVESSETFQTQSAVTSYTLPQITQLPSDQANTPASQSTLLPWGSFTDQKCLDSLFATDQAQALNLRTSAPATFNNGALFCTYQHPNYHIRPRSTLSGELLKIFIMGTEFQEMVSTNSILSSLLPGGIKANGIYKIAAEVRSVELATRHNCHLL